MTTQQLIAGLLDIQTGRIPTDCIIDMVPYLVVSLQASEQLTPELSNLLMSVEKYAGRPEAVKLGFFDHQDFKKYLSLMP